MKLRANIIEKRGTLQVIVSYKDSNGKIRQKWKDTKLKKKGNKKRAEKIRDEFLLELESQLAMECECANPDLLFYDYLLNYLEVSKKQVAFNTYVGYKHYVHNRIYKFFYPKKIKLNRLKPYHLQDFYQYMLNDDCTANTVIHYHAFIRKALQEAVITELISTNVADKVRKPKKKQFVSQVYNQHEILKLLDILSEEKLYLVVLLTAFYGLRRSEVLGLKWSAIDFFNKKIVINHVIIENPENMSQLIKKDQTKNSSSYRTLPLVETIERALVNQAKWQQDNRILLGDDYILEDNEYVFTMEDGRLMKPQYVTHRLSKLIKKNGLKKIRFHDLRHSNASIMLDSGQNMKSIQEWLGHASYSTTANLYTHLTAGVKERAAEALENAFGFKE